MRNPNEVQMGGDHYKGKSKSGQEHWDVAYDFEFDTGQYNVTKYVMRHGYKNGFNDLIKAYHHLVKYLSVRYAEAWDKFCGEEEARIYKRWEDADGSELPQWVFKRLEETGWRRPLDAGDWPAVDKEVEVEARDYIADHINSMPTLHPLLQSLTLLGNSKTSRLIDISNKLELLDHIERTPAKFTKHVSEMMVFNREEADMVERVFACGNTTVLKEKDDATRQGLMKRLKEVFRIATPHPGELSGGDSRDPPGWNGAGP